jgi:hypothetical protein
MSTPPLYLESDADHHAAKQHLPSAAEKRIAYLNKMARGEVSNTSDDDDSSSDSDSSSSTSDHDSESQSADEDVHDDLNVRKKKSSQDEIPMGEETRRFAILHCDWSRMRAVDLLALFQSFVPSTGKGAIEHVSIYPSDFGIEKMAQENQHGPQGPPIDRSIYIYIYIYIERESDRSIE